MISSYIEAFFMDEKMLASVIPSYKVRKEQLEMAHLVAKALYENKTLMVEAGTGVGKTLAYLVPALIFASQEKKKVAISTHTIALQEQMQTQAIPLVKKLLSLDLRSLEVLGMNNYLCLRKLEEKWEENSLFRTRDPRVEMIKQRAKKDLGTKRGLEGSILPLWREVQAEKEDCVQGDCEYFKDCFFYRNRKQAQDAQVLILNHNLLLLDLLVKSQREENSGLFPHFDAIIIDEAHHIEAVAKKQLTYEMSMKGFAKELNGLKTKNSQAKKEALDAASEFFSHLEKGIGDEQAGKLLQKKDFTDPYFLEYVNPSLLALQQTLKALQTDSVFSEKKNEMLLEIEQCTRKFEELEHAFNFFDPNSHALWMEKKGGSTLFLGKPSMAKTLQELFFQSKTPLIFSSATLSVKESFAFFKKSIGVNPEDPVLEKILFSPYDYEKNVFFALASDLPNPDEKGFLSQSLEAIYQCLAACCERTFVLFTSYEALFEAKRVLEKKIQALGLELVCQGEMDTNEMLSIIRKKKKTVLFGTDTFWEGVDVKGLRLIILCKLPFASFQDPQTEAESLLMASSGKNFFMESMLPKAAIKFKQGFGRLLRSEQDFGAIICLDKRLKEKGYGKIILESLPTKELVYDSTKNIIKEFKGFLERSGIEPLTSTMPLLRSTN